MSLWRCVVEVELFVEAEDEADAVDSAEAHAGEELANGCSGTCVTKVTSLKKVPSAARHSLPWGGDGERTIEQILEGRAP